jgi:predicted nucleic acid-binding Zn ribbon protein
MVQLIEFNMGRPPKHIGDSLGSLIKDLGFEKKLKQVRAVELWPEIVGDNIAKISQADRVYEGILYVKVKSSAWRTELLFQKRTILERIDAKLGKHVIKDIRFI